MMSSKRCALVSNYIIEQLNNYNLECGNNYEEGKLSKQIPIFLSCKRLQKLLYFCDVLHMLRNNGTPMFKEVFYAWPSGPVIPSVYSDFMNYINGQMQTIDLSQIKESLNESDIEIIRDVLEATKEYDTFDLIKETQDGPWESTYIPEDANHEQRISLVKIYNYYKKYGLDLPINQHSTQKSEDSKQMI